MTATDDTGLRPNEDSSLQNWGRHQLPAIAPAIHSLAGREARANEDAKQVTQGVAKMAQMANDGTLPADKRLAAETEALAKEMKQIDNEAEALNARRRAAAAKAEALPGMYRSQHETDEDRLDTPRGSRAAERRADVGTAEQDT